MMPEIKNFMKNTSGQRASTVVLCLIALSIFAGGAQAEEPSFDTECVTKLLQSAADEMTAGEIKERCRTSAKHNLVEQDAQDLVDVADQSDPPPENALASKLGSDRRLIAEPFSILAHQPNYVLAAVYNFSNWNDGILDSGAASQSYKNKNVETQFQISAKVPLAIGLLGGRADLYAAYTNRSFWQSYNTDNSQPFRETNHEPELWVQFANDWQVLGFTNSVNAFGYVHQSNGQRGELSRGWDRIFGNFIVSKNGFVMGIKPWVWLNKHANSSDNPDIDRYMGHGELTFAYKRNGHVFTTMLRNQLESGFDRGAVQMSWSFPLLDYSYLKGYVHYFNGYGESLIDYNNKVQTLGVGISVTDWLK